MPRELYTVEQVAEALKANRGYIYITAEKLQISKATMAKYMNMWPELKDVVKEARGKILDVAENVVHNNLLSKDKRMAMEAAKFVLTTVGRKRGYEEGKRMTITGDAKGSPIQVTHSIDSLAALSLEDKKRILEAIRMGAVPATSALPALTQQVPLLEDQSQEEAEWTPSLKEANLELEHLQEE